MEKVLVSKYFLEKVIAECAGKNDQYESGNLKSSAYYYLNLISDAKPKATGRTSLKELELNIAEFIKVTRAELSYKVLSHKVRFTIDGVEYNAMNYSEAVQFLRDCKRRY